MKKIVFFCIPAHGHTNPTLGVVRELVSRGHQVWYYSYERFRRKIEAAGAVFVPCDDHDMEMKLTPEEASRLGRDLVLSTRVLTETTLALDEMVCREMERLQPDCIVADSMAVWGKAVARKLGIPFVSSTTTFAFNRYSAQIMPQSRGELVRFLLAVPRCSPFLRKLRKKGYPIRSVFDILVNEENTHTVVYTSPEFQPRAETFSREYYSFVGPSVRPAGPPVEKIRQKLIYISMGTVDNDLLPLYRACISALEGTPWQGILSVGDQVDPGVFGELPEQIRVYPQVDQMAVLQKADVFLTHCGMNSASEGLYHGVPLLMLPRTQEQKGVAARVFQLGAGEYLQEQTPEAIRAGIQRLLEEPSFRAGAEEIAAGFHACAGARGAADKILEQCR